MKLNINFTKAITIVFFITLITVLISNIIIGGDALSGKVENNKYFVWDAIHKTNNYGEKRLLEDKFSHLLYL